LSEHEDLLPLFWLLEFDLVDDFWLTIILLAFLISKDVLEFSTSLL